MAYITRPFRLLFPRQTKPIVILSGHLLDGNLKAFFDYARTNRNLPYEIYYVGIDEMVCNKLNSEYDSGILCASRFENINKVLDAKCIVTSHGPLIPLLKIMRREIKYIDVWHGTPFLKYKREQLGDMKNYTALFLPSESLKIKYQDHFNFDDVDLKITGLARHDILYHADELCGKIKMELHLSDFNHVILYAPTWRKKNEKGEIPFEMSSDQYFKRMSTFLNKYNAVLITRIHQNSSIQVPLENKYSNVVNIPQFEYPNTEKLLTVVDVLISDWSSIMTDYCALDRPIIITESPMPESWISQKTWIDRGGKFVKNYMDLEDTMLEFIKDKNIELEQSQIKMKEIVLGKMFDGNVCKRYDSELRKLIFNGQ